MSALLMRTRSANSITPFLMACKSSPAFGKCMSTNISVILATAISLCPTPTVSTITTSNPAASARSIVSRVFSATPPRLPAVGLGRIKAFSLIDNCSIRVLSPRIEPPETVEDGSIANTATRCPWAIKYSPSASIKVDLPTPGTPDIPSRKDLPVKGII